MQVTKDYWANRITYSSENKKKLINMSVCNKFNIIVVILLR